MQSFAPIIFLEKHILYAAHHGAAVTSPPHCYCERFFHALLKNISSPTTSTVFQSNFKSLITTKVNVLLNMPVCYWHKDW